MREYIFRGKRLDNGEWVEGSLIIYDWDNGYVSIYSIEEEMAFQVDPETVGQWTGFRDNDGDRIYEDDILKMITRVKDGKKRIFTVKWCDECGRWVLPCDTDDELETDFTSFWGYDFKIIGNVYDNPELLGGETDD